MQFIIKKSEYKSLKADLLVVGMFKDGKQNKSLDIVFNKSLSKALKIEQFNGSYKKNITLYGESIKRLQLVGLGQKKDFNPDKLRALFADVVRTANSSKVKTITIDADSFNLSNDQYAQACSEGLLLGSYGFNNYKSKKDSNNSTEKICFLGESSKSAIHKGFKIAEGVNFARDLGNHPANILTPEYMANLAVELSSKCNLMKSKIIDVKDFVKMGFGSFYSVAKASVLPAKMILVEYNGGKKGDKPLALVGKGLTFDTGGISLKPPARMDEMKFDMCGSGTVLGVMNAVVELKPKLNIVFAIGATENMPGGNASRPGDIVTAYNGKTIEVLNTDAEGRLVLADVLSYVADKYKPEAMIDFATLTGAVLVALGNRATGLMGNNEDLINEIKESGATTNEKVWELPLWPEYSKDIKGKYADIQNIGKAGAGTITAGAFLKEFVGDTPWCHLDIAGTAWGPKEPSYQPKVGATGVAVRLIYDLIEKRCN
tara:strand:- start:1411 stop:2871 length:1461 start_codon:yes stop_codon:yes gene_type:complete